MFSYYCTSCPHGKFLFGFVCVDNCPDGMISQLSTQSCMEPIIGKIDYFPTTLFACAFACAFLIAKLLSKSTEFFTAAAAIFGLAEFFSWSTLAYSLFYDNELSKSNRNGFFAITLLIVLSCFFTSTAWTIKVWLTFCREDMGFRNW
jgi:hypothetical protein